MMQSEAVGSAYTTWRREWKGPGKEYSAGAVVWQLNDCWPVTSWAIIDYFYRPKPAYFSIARAMAPISLGMRREVAKNRPCDRPRNFYEYGAFQSRKVTLAIWATNAHEERTFTLLVTAHDIVNGWTTQEPWKREVVLGENRSTELYSGDCPQPPEEKWVDKVAPSGTVVVSAKLVDESGQIVARYCDWPQPYKLLDLPDPGMKVVVSGEEVRLSVEKPAKGVWLSVVGDDEGVEFSDNSLGMFPGDDQVVGVKGLKGRQLTVAYLGKEKPTPV